MDKKQLAEILAQEGEKLQRPLTADEYFEILDKNPIDDCRANDTPIVKKRPEVLECDVVRFQNNKEKWVAFVGLIDGKPYEIFTGLMDDDEGILIPKRITKGRIIKAKNADGSHRYDFQYENTRGYKTTVEGLSEKFNKEYWNYAKLISGVLRYHMPVESVIHLVSTLSLDAENINTWKIGVERALKKYVQGDDMTDELGHNDEEDSMDE